MPGVHCFYCKITVKFEVMPFKDYIFFLAMLLTFLVKLISKTIFQKLLITKTLIMIKKKIKFLILKKVYDFEI